MELLIIFLGVITELLRHNSLFLGDTYRRFRGEVSPSWQPTFKWLRGGEGREERRISTGRVYGCLLYSSLNFPIVLEFLK